MRGLISYLLSVAAIASPYVLAANCKTSPLDASWPSVDEWATLNNSIGGSLIQSAPAASSCYPGNPFGSSYNCTEVKRHWSYAANHSMWPESVDYSIWNNNSCVPPGVSGFTKDKGCSIGGMPQYILNATTEDQIARVMAWASDRDIRIVIKSTGHDLSGRYVSFHSDLLKYYANLSVMRVQINRSLLTLNLDPQFQPHPASATVENPWKRR